MAGCADADRVEVEKTWNEEGFSCDLRTDPPGRVWRDCLHGVDKLVTVVEGELEVEIAGSKHHLKPGVEILIPARTAHTLRATGQTAARWLSGFRRSTMRLLREPSERRPRVACVPRKAYRS
jgi:mannose-6-phosphate isomerase-like protein (cupin superfamily)